MKLIIESTTKIVHLNGFPCRIWEGETGKGIKVHVFVSRVAVRKGDDAAEFERDLEEQRGEACVVKKVSELLAGQRKKGATS